MWESGGVDMELAFLELAQALKWPHFRHTYSNSKEEKKCQNHGNRKYTVAFCMVATK